MLVDVVAFVAGWVSGWWLLWTVPVPPLATRRSPAIRPPLSIVIPARDEEAALPVLLTSLHAQLGPGDEVVVVDDDSGDATAAVARAGGAAVVPAPPRPAGWLGKPWACHTGAATATGDLLAFLDADTCVEPGGLDRLVAGHVACGGLYSVQPWHLVPRPHERLAALFNVVAMMGTGAFTPAATHRRSSRPAPSPAETPRRCVRRDPVGAFGPCLLTTAADYRAAGGHAAVRGWVLDDLALAERYRARGLAVTVRGGRGVISFRMYPAGLGQLVEGFTKNFAAAARRVRPMTVVLVVAWLVALSTPLALAPEAPLLAAALYCAAAVQLHVHLRRLGSFGAVTAAVYVVPLACFVAVFARSVAVTALRRRVRWKGRDVPARPAP